MVCWSLDVDVGVKGMPKELVVYFQNGNLQIFSWLFAIETPDTASS